MLPAVPFSLVGAFWLLYLLDYNMSVGVWVGLIALAGLDAETGGVMLLYLNHAWDKYVAEDRMHTLADLKAAVVEGAVQRIRPKMMTVLTIFVGLLPVMWSPVHQAGADVMKRIAAPMVGGVITSFILELLLYPVIFVLWRKRHLPRGGEEPEKLEMPPAMKRRSSWKRLLHFGVIAMGLAAVFYGGILLWESGSGKQAEMVEPTGEPLATATVGELTATLHGELRFAPSGLLVEFRDANGEPVDAGTVKFELDMSMPGMTMHTAGEVNPAGGPGQYRIKIKPDMAGDWVAKLSIDGPHGKAQASFPVDVKP